MAPELPVKVANKHTPQSLALHESIEHSMIDLSEMLKITPPYSHTGIGKLLPTPLPEWLDVDLLELMHPSALFHQSVEHSNSDVSGAKAARTHSLQSWPDCGTEAHLLCCSAFPVPLAAAADASAAAQVLLH